MGRRRVPARSATPLPDPLPARSSQGEGGQSSVRVSDALEFTGRIWASCVAAIGLEENSPVCFHIGVVEEHMKTIAVLMLFCASIYGADTNTNKTELTSIDPVHVKFGSPSTVFVTNTNALDAVKIAERFFMPTNQFILDARIRNRFGEIWCKRAPDEHYRDPFRESPVSIEELKKLHNASIDQLMTLLGHPELTESGLDHAGTVFWQWRICNGKQGDQFQAIEITIGFYSKDRDHVLFLLTRVAQGR